MDSKKTNNSPTILKKELVLRIHKKFPAHLKKDINAVVDIIFVAMTEALTSGRRIEIRGFGSFSLHKQKGREFINPKTKQHTVCPPNYRIVFKPGKWLNNITSSGPFPK